MDITDEERRDLINILNLLRSFEILAVGEDITLSEKYTELFSRVGLIDGSGKITKDSRMRVTEELT